MKLPLPLRIQESLASRISMWVVLCVVVILTGTAFFANSYVVKGIKLEESVKANGILYIVGQRIDAALITVEVAVRNHLDDIRDNLDDEEALYRITQRMLEDNPAIVGSAIAFREGYFPEKGKWFAPYSYREAHSEGCPTTPGEGFARSEACATILSKQLGCVEYDYLRMDWYATADSLGHDYWSEPYFDRGGGEMLMTTYSYPLKDEAGRTIAVVTADILLDYLTELADVDYYDNAFVCIMGRTGKFIALPSKELAMQKNIFILADESGHPEVKEVAQEMIDGKSGMRRWNSPKLGDSYIFFVPFEHTGWSMAIVCKTSELFKGVRQTALILGTLFVLMLVVLTYLLRRGVHKLIAPLTTFTQAVDEVARGNLQAKLPVIRSKDEMQRLHHSFSTMQQSLVRQMEELKQVNEAKGRIEGELKVARDIQLSMLPTMPPKLGGYRGLNKEQSDIGSDPQPPNLGGLDVYASLTPAREVGGDLYDFFVRDGKLFFCIGDVSGKGVPAALVMATTLCQFRIAASHVDDVGKIVRFINRAVCEGNETMMFVTFFAGVLDLSSGRLQCVNAGHNKPLIIEEGKSNPQFLDAKPGLPLGVDEDAPYAVRDYDLPSGAMLFLYTDGLTEAMTAQREQFGRQRLVDSLQTGLGCEEQIAAMTQAVRQFVAGAPQSDDLTMLTIRYNKQNDYPQSPDNDLRQLSSPRFPAWGP